MTRPTRLLTCERGQTTTEYLMIAGLTAAIAIATLNYLQPRFRCQLQRVVTCMINDYDDCMSVPLFATPFCF